MYKKKSNTLGVLIFTLFVLQFGIKLLEEIYGGIIGSNISIANLIISLLLIIIFIKKIFKYETKITLINYDIRSLIIIFSIFIIQIYWGVTFYLEGNSEVFSHYTTFFINQLFLISLFYFMGYNFRSVVEFLQRKKLISTTCLTIVYLIIIITLIYGRIGFSSNSVLFYGLDISYLYLGDVFAIFSLFIIAAVNSYKKKISLFFITTIFLYLIGSRSSMYFFLIVFAVYLIKFFLHRGKSLAKISIIILCLFAVVIVALSIDIDSLMENRMFRIIFSDSGVIDYSSLGRNALLDSGIENIKENWFFGDYFAEYTKRREWGSYIHNILSYWEEYGIIVFVIFLYQSVTTLYNNLKRYFFVTDKITEFSTYIAIFCILSIIFTRSYTYHYAWIAFGLTSSMIKIHKKNKIQGE